VICQLPKDLGGSHGRAEIVLSDGSLWVATPLPNGLYEFVTADERGHNTTARWVRRSTPRRNSGLPEAAGNTGNGFKFTFSIIDPNSRRHPIMASITQNKLDIPDYYTSVSSSAGKHPPTTTIRLLPGEADDPSVEEEPPLERTAHAIDDRMKILIQVTGIWVALRQGWSPYFKYNDAVTMSAISTNPRTASGGRARSLSLTPDAGRPSPAATCSSTPESSHSTFGAVGGKILRTCVKGNPAAGVSPQFEQAAAPKRALSTGTAFMRRAAARRAGQPPSIVASDSEGEGVVYPPQRRVTEKLDSSLSGRIPTPPSLNLPGSSATTPDTPTRPQRRVQSAYIPSSALQHGYVYEKVGGHSADITDSKQTSDFDERPKISRWKTFTNFLRRSCRSD